MKRHRSILPILLVAALAGCGGRTAEEKSGAAASGGSASPPPPAAAGALRAQSLYDAGPRAGESPVDAAAAAAGEKLFSTKGCTACHKFGQRFTGPDLKGVTSRRTAQWMEHQILEPDVMVKTDPISHALFAQFALQMPKQGLTPEQAKQVIEYVKRMDKEGK